MVARDIYVYIPKSIHISVYIFIERERDRVHSVFDSASTVVRDQQRGGDIVASERSVE